MAHGKSTLWICQALADNGKGRHIAMDPWQDNYPGGPSPGLWNLEQAGLRHLVEFHLDSSHRVLPALELRGQQIDFAFIDGFHTFDHTLTDFFLIDKMLTLDGLIVFDDVSWPSVRKVVRFVLGNRPYRDVDSPLAGGFARTVYRKGRRVVRGLGALPRALRHVVSNEEAVIHEVPQYR